MESEVEIPDAATKTFFEIEAHISSLDYCYRRISEIYLQKYYQIYCEKEYTKYHNAKLGKQVDKLKEEF